MIAAAAALLFELAFQTPANPFVRAAQMLPQHGRRAIGIGPDDAVQQFFVRGHQHLAEIDIGDVPVEQEHMDLRAQVGPRIFQPAMIGAS